MNLLTNNDISENKDYITRFYGYFETGIKGIKFIGTNDPFGTRNKGRLCINDIVVSESTNSSLFISNLYEAIYD